MSQATRTPVDPLAPQASIVDTQRVLSLVLLPLIGRGLIMRRPPVVNLAERLDLDRRAIRELQRLRRRYGPGPVLLRTPGRPFAMVLEPDDVHRVLAQSPEPFAAATVEKRSALKHFQPHGVLASDPPERTDRRRFNEEVLDSPRPVHGHADRFLGVVEDEVDQVAGLAARRGRLTWSDFIQGWFRAVRRVILGDAARADERLTARLGRLRARANWGYLAPTHRRERDAFLRRIQFHLDRAEPGSLAAVMRDVPTTAVTDPSHQVPQWLFAFDAGAIATFRTLALYATHAAYADEIRREIGDQDPAVPAELPRTRAAVLESLRLWPTTPGILRDTTAETHWRDGRLPAGTGIVIFAPYFHRDDERVPEADIFAPQLWSQPRSMEDWPLIPFSEGPVICPGRNLVLLMASSMLAALLRRHDFRLTQPGRLSPDEPLPSVLNPYNLEFLTAGQA